MRRIKTKIPIQIYLRDITFRCGDGEREPFRLPLNRGRSVFLRRRNPSLILSETLHRGQGECSKSRGSDRVRLARLGILSTEFLAFHWPGISISTSHLSASPSASKGEISARHLKIRLLKRGRFSREKCSLMKDKRYYIPFNNQGILCPTPYM